jgi:predicted DNA repair protein MutK
LATSSLFALIDDIATILDDVSIMTKVVAKKTAGVLGDDLALNAQQVAGVNADRELPVVWAVAKGSLKNKLILVPAALLISAIAPWAVTPLLMVGGAYLCYEGFEKLAHKFLHSRAEDAEHHSEQFKALSDSALDMIAYERDKIRGAVRTDFVLSAEIIVIALGTVQSAPFATQIAVLAGIGAIMTAGVYGLVAGIVKLDDAGLYLVRTGRRLLHVLGTGILGLAPLLMKSLSVAGTAAMFLVGGGILLHGLPYAHTALEAMETRAHALPRIGDWLVAAAPVLVNLLAGVAAGAITLALVGLVRKSLAVIRDALS